VFIFYFEVEYIKRNWLVARSNKEGRKLFTRREKAKKHPQR